MAYNTFDLSAANFRQFVAQAETASSAKIRINDDTQTLAQTNPYVANAVAFIRPVVEELLTDMNNKGIIPMSVSKENKPYPSKATIRVEYATKTNEQGEKEFIFTTNSFNQSVPVYRITAEIGDNGNFIVLHAKDISDFTGSEFKLNNISLKTYEQQIDENGNPLYKDGKPLMKTVNAKGKDIAEFVAKYNASETFSKMFDFVYDNGYIEQTPIEILKRSCDNYLLNCEKFNPIIDPNGNPVKIETSFSYGSENYKPIGGMSLRIKNSFDHNVLDISLANNDFEKPEFNVKFINFDFNKDGQPRNEKEPALSGYINNSDSARAFCTFSEISDMIIQLKGFTEKEQRISAKLAEIEQACNNACNGTCNYVAQVQNKKETGDDKLFIFEPNSSRVIEIGFNYKNEMYAKYTDYSIDKEGLPVLPNTSGNSYFSSYINSLNDLGKYNLPPQLSNVIAETLNLQETKTYNAPQQAQVYQTPAPAPAVPTAPSFSYNQPVTPQANYQPPVPAQQTPPPAPQYNYQQPAPQPQQAQAFSGNYPEPPVPPQVQQAHNKEQAFRQPPSQPVMQQPIQQPVQPSQPSYQAPQQPAPAVPQYNQQAHQQQPPFWKNDVKKVAEQVAPATSNLYNLANVFQSYFSNQTASINENGQIVTATARTEKTKNGDDKIVLNSSDKQNIRVEIGNKKNGSFYVSYVDFARRADGSLKAENERGQCYSTFVNSLEQLRKFPLNPQITDVIAQLGVFNEREKNQPQFVRTQPQQAQGYNNPTPQQLPQQQGNYQRPTQPVMQPPQQNNYQSQYSAPTPQTPPPAPQYNYQQPAPQPQQAQAFSGKYPEPPVPPQVQQANYQQPTQPSQAQEFYQPPVQSATFAPQNNGYTQNNNGGGRIDIAKACQESNDYFMVFEPVLDANNCAVYENNAIISNDKLVLSSVYDNSRYVEIGNSKNDKPYARICYNGTNQPPVFINSIQEAQANCPSPAIADMVIQQMGFTERSRQYDNNNRSRSDNHSMNTAFYQNR